jgi:ATP-binding cassette subfamily F protein 3
VLLVSHDRALLRAVCDEFWVVSQGRVQSFAGDLDDYQRMVADNTPRSDGSAKVSKKPAALEPAQPGGRQSRQRQAQMRQDKADRLKPLKKELQQLETSMQTHQSEWALLEAKMQTPLAGAEMADLGRQMKSKQQQMAQAEERWLALSEQLDAMGQTLA